VALAATSWISWLAGLAVAFGFSRLLMIRIGARSLLHSLRPMRRVAGRLDEARGDAPLAVTWLGHSTVLLQVGERFVLTDPVLFDRVGRLQRRLVEVGLALERLPRIDLTVVSHSHLDHLDQPSLRATPGDGALVTPRGVGKHLSRALPFAERIELDAGRSAEFRGVKVTVVRAKHWGGRWGVDGAWDKSCGGFVFEKDGFVVYYSGDTGYDGELFREVGRRWSIDVALLPVGPYRPRWVMKRHHLDAPAVLRAFDDLRARHLMAVHHSTFIQSYDPLHAPRREFAELARRRPDADRIHIPFFGRQLLFDRRDGRLLIAGERGPTELHE
jgi:L-ascorbate metabolism protein UlaG (beta-lactamase superfamily)